MTSLSRAQARELDRRAVDEFGVPSIVLMENAGRGVVDALITLGARGPFVILCGPGNNGGDGFVIARHLDNRGESVRVILAAPRERVVGDAAIQLGILERSGARIETVEAAGPLESTLAEAGCLVDALLGTGFQGEPREPIARLIQAMNRAGRPIATIDLPSGLDADTGHPASATVRGTWTLTMVAPKRGFLTPLALPFLGQVQIVDIGAPRRLVESVLGGNDAR